VLPPYVPRLVTDWAATPTNDLWRPIAGTMVFADLSGFTAMSERLSRHGRVGAEEVTDAIGACFTELLAVAYDAGGGLLKFGGDALLLAFRGDHHAHRAVWAAAAMRERLREAGKLKTSAGNVTLRMSVGVHSGTFDCFLVGSPSRELLVIGPAASEVIAMEHGASAGQIVVSSATAAALPEGCVGDRLEGGFLLRRAPERPPAAAHQLPEVAPDIDLREFVPLAVHEHVLAGGGSPEHRVVTVAFVHFGGLDAFLARQGPTETADALDALVGTVAQACAVHGVALLATDVDADGGKFLLTAGAPSVQGHEEERMLATARRIVEADLAIPVRVGVNRGPVFAGDVGPHYRRTYTVMGDTVNLAARLMAAAAPGRVVATASVLDRAVGFASSPLPPMRVKGKRAPVEAYEVGAARARRSSDHADAVELPFVGRTAELAQLETFLADARAGEGVAVRIAGPAGIGKSRLLGELRARSPATRSIRATCEAYEVSTPYATIARLVREALALPNDAAPAGVADALRAAVAVHAPELEPYIPLLGSVLDLDIPDTPETATLAPQYRAARVADTTASLLAAALRGPALVVIDDSEWIDEASREVVEKLGSLAAEARMVLVCIARDDTRSDKDALLVGPLAPEEVEAALRQATEDAPLRPHELAALTSRADGNPLFLTELWRAATDGEDTDALPDSVEALVTAQLDRLKPALRTVLGYAAILGRGFDRAELRELIGDDVHLDANTWRALAEFVDLEAGDRARFRHGLMRDAAYGKLPFRRRRELHLRAARAIERREQARPDSEAELLSLHFFHAQDYRETWHYARIAGQHARDKYANVAAAVLLQRALAAARKLPDLDPVEVADVREALGDVHEQRSGEYELALADYRAARRLVRGDPVREAALLKKEAWIPERIGRYPDAIRSIRKGLQLVDALQGVAAGRARAQLYSAYAVIRQGQGRSREAIGLCKRAITEAQAVDDRGSEAHALYVLDWAYMELGEIEMAKNLPRALELYTDLGDLCGQGMVINGLGASAHSCGDWQEAIAWFERARDAYDRAGSAVDAALATANIAEVLSDQGRFDAAESHLRDALRVSTAAGYHYDIALILSFLGRNCARAGRFNDGFLFLGTAREEFENTGCYGDVARIDAWHAEALSLAGDAPAALALADATLRTAKEERGVSPEVPLLERVRAEALWSLGDMERASRALVASVDAARSRGAEYELALAIDVLERMPELGTHFDNVVELLAERDAVFERLGVVVVTL
jgi:class 3 adenylate cyclase/tetratricopeptide (TPR) repeat protein